MDEPKTAVFLPEENITISFEVTDEKPFNKCFECHSFRNGCSGPNLTVMDIDRVCEFLQLARIFLKKSYQDVADGTGVSLATVKRTLTNKISDPSFYTISAISRFLCGDPNGKYPCAIPNIAPETDTSAKVTEATRELERALADNQDYKKALDDIHGSYNAEMQRLRDDAKRQVDYLLGELQRARDNAEHWRYENDRKGKLIDKYMEKIVAG